MNRRALLTIMAALTALAIHLLVAAAPARGDAGDRKVFAAGAGARALALGGAYTAVVDDATALFWNPAGLQRVDAKEVAFYTTTLPADGLSYAFFGYAHPTLRFGTLGAGVMRFSASGIEGRDERNFVTEEFDDTQMRWLFGYANRLSPSTSYGIGLKVDTHSIAGSSATAIGADLGAIYRPEWFRARALSLARLGGAVRFENALGPREKLGAESVTDPRALHLGLSYELPLQERLGSSIAVLEWVREEGGESRLLLGSEVEQAGIALRAGAGPDEWTLGGGVKHGGLRFDYAYAPGDLAANHRFSIHYAFGATVDEMLADAEAREEREVNERLAQEIGARETERVSSLVDAGRDHLAAGRYDEARNAFEGALLFVHDDAELQQLHRRAEEEGFLAIARGRVAAGDTVEALIAYRQAIEVNPENDVAQDEIERITARRDASRAADDAMRRREASGVEALAAGRYDEAVTIFSEISAAAPDSRDAERFLQLARTGLHNEIDLLVSEGTLLDERGLTRQAVSKWKNALALAPGGDADISQRIREAQARLARSGLPPAATPRSTAPAAPPLALSAEEQAEVASLYQKGVEVFKAGRTTEAIEYWEIVWRRDPDHGDVKSYLTKGYLIQGMEYYTAGRLPQAIEVWQRALDVDPEDQKARHYVERATTELIRTREISSR